MDKRKRIGLLCPFGDNWLGGLYYIENLIMALNHIDDEHKPTIDLYCYNNDSFSNIQRNTNYPYLNKNLIRLSFFRKALRRLASYITSVNSLNIWLFKINPHDVIVYPAYSYFRNDNLVYWIPDFQDKLLPEMFSSKELRIRDRIVKNVCKHNIPIVFSSNDSQNDFYRYYPQFKNKTTFVVHFAVNQMDYSNLNIDTLKQKYHIGERYFLCANQFWKHKNHLFLFKAFKKAIESGLNMQLVCTGNMSDHRNPEYIQEIRDFISTNHLEKKILILGMIEKENLLCLMKYSYAVIQPSLFEGWNTTVEDCKAMSKFVFLSDLKVHREQLNKNVCFFDPYSESDLVYKLLNVIPKEDCYDYSNNIKQFGKDFFEVISWLS